jgi:peptidoglycan hydrolase-like protein with peptidoglycan-binding domain
MVVALGVTAVACGSSNVADVSRPTGTAAPVDAAKSTFCSDLGHVVQLIDQYAHVFQDSQTTVGQLQTAATSLTASRQQVTSSAKDLADSIDAANRAATAASSTTTSLLQAQTADEHIAAITSAEKDLQRAVQGIAPSESLRGAGVALQAAAFEVEQAYVTLFVDAGCLADDAAAARTATEYVKTLQQDLTTAGFYTGAVDGLYGPQTVAAVQALQASAGLPQTGVVDPTTEAALSKAVGAKGTQAVLNVAALQGALTAGGFYKGPIDGKWSPEVEQALAAYQTSQQLPATGQIDPATLAALLFKGSNSPGSTTTVPGPTTSAPTPTTAPSPTTPSSPTTAPVPKPTTAP